MANKEVDSQKSTSEQRDFELVQEGAEEVMRINAIKWPYSPSIEDNSAVMGFVVEKLLSAPHVSRLIFKQRRNYTYDYKQTQTLIEVALLYDHFVRQKKVFGPSALGGIDPRFFQLRSNAVNYIIFNLMKTDPIGAYVELKRFIREEKILAKSDVDARTRESREVYLNTLLYIYTLLGRTKLIDNLKDELDGYSIGDRSIYKEIFRPAITPDFMYTRLMAEPPLDGEQIDFYRVGNIDITVYKIPGDIKTLYHISPPEFKLNEDEYSLLDLAKSVLAEHKPREEEFLDPTKMRRTFYNIGRDLIGELAETKGIVLSYSKIQELAEILVRYTVGFGLIEVLLQDPKVQDITANGPIGENPIFLMHQDYDECITNVIPSSEDANSWASKFRLISGRPLDEANPVLDTELSIPGARARVAVMTTPLSPTGLAYALRRHRDTPWTLPLFMQNKMINPLGAGLISFLVDGARTMLIAGTRSSGKTSFLGSLLVEIMRRYRVITVEDSVTGDSTLLFERNGRIERTTIGGLIDGLIEKNGCWYNLTDHEIAGNPENIKVYSMNEAGKIILSKVSKFIRHKVNKPIYEVTTRTGRKIKVTGDHSLFTLDNEAEIKEVKASDLAVGRHIVVPRILPNFNPDKKFISAFEYALNFKNAFFKGKPIEKILIENRSKVKQMGKECDYSKATINNWFKRSILPARILKDLISLGQMVDLDDLKFKISGNSLTYLPVKIALTDDLLTLVGLWLADGCYDKRSTILSVIDNAEREIFYRIAKIYGLPVKMHSDGISLQIHSLTFKTLLREILDLKGDAYTKRIPSWAFGLSRSQVAKIIKGLFSGDGCVSDKEVVIALASRGLLEDTQNLLSQFGVIFRIGKFRSRDKTYNARISALGSLKTFETEVGILQEYKKAKLTKLCSKSSTHDSSDVVPLNLEVKKALKELTCNFNSNDYIERGNHIGKKKLGQIIQSLKLENKLISNLKLLAESDLLFDQVREIKKIEDYSGYVYDLSVPECENFVCENIVAHNTLELPVKALRDLGYNVQQMKVRAALMTGGAEVGADEGIRTSLRLGDSSLIVGEVRSLEAKALYEAMRIGALANVVAGTIHGADPYGVYDRVVNDLGVPKTSFKATDVIIVANPIKTPDGLHRVKRITQITEVRKHWVDDPLAERGFVDLMKYNPETDTLDPTPELINGESETLKAVAANVREWAGNWDAIWENVLLRARLKENLLNYSLKLNRRDVLEAPFVVQSNDMFHRISDDVRMEVGSLDPKLIEAKWEEWMNLELKKKV